MGVMLEVAIGLVFVYLVLSLLASAIAEALEHFLRYRADYLRQGVEKLILGGNKALRERLYAHPIIKSLFTPSRLEGFGRAPGPTYIPSRQFTIALLDLIRGDDTVAGPLSVEQLENRIQTDTTIPPSLARALRTLIADAGDDIEKVKANVQEWFDGSMDAVAGWYKRRTQFVLLGIGIMVAVVVNADTLSIITTLSNDSAVRAAVVRAAEQHIENSGRPGQSSDQQTDIQPGPADQLAKDVREGVQSAVDQLGSLGLPVGWRRFDEVRDGAALEGKSPEATAQYLVANRVLPGQAEIAGHVTAHALGWLLTAIAVSFGAPFWFDILNKIMVVRSTVKPREKSQEEGSEDRRASSAAQTLRIEVVPTK
jgi:hypothetical protein